SRLAQKVKNRAGYVWEMKNEWFIFRDGRLVLEPTTGMVPFVKEVARDLREEAERLMANTEATAAKLDHAPSDLTIKALKEANADAYDPQRAAIIADLLRVMELKAAAD